ncbi:MULTISPECIES: GNAT family N-acetyltransferase [unclassified Clostridium]|uniref:GNAT family N-acetyltransferase n=1 Tax=unclassified Clostridium TaxID=2614128 RepID=UPI0039C88941
MFKLVKPSLSMEKEYIDYVTEWEATEEKIVPNAAKRDSMSFKELVNKWEEYESERMYEKGLVPSSMYFLIDNHNKIYGAIDIRHELNDYLLQYGGHIGYGIRPSQRRKGYASQMLTLALPIAKELGINKALITCDKSNVGSAKTIMNNGGILENEVINGDEITQRYWITLS